MLSWADAEKSAFKGVFARFIRVRQMRNSESEVHGRTAVFTIIAKNYLPCARVLMNSVAEHHPDWSRFVILADQIDGYFDPRSEDFEVVLSVDLPIRRPRWFHFKYTLMELSTAVKPYVFEYLFRAEAFDRIIYLDPDIRIYSPLHEVTEALKSANIVLTPHLTGPLEDDKRPAEIDILRSGTYNLGFIGVARSRETEAFLAWWRERLYDHCFVDIARGLFVDQRWIDLVPGIFQGVLVLRDPGCNVAYWNLAHRMVSRSGSGYEAGGSPLSFFHFSGYAADQPDKLSRHQNRFKVRDLSEAGQQLVEAYRQELLHAGYFTCRKWPYGFASFQNGTHIPDMGRPIHRETPEVVDAISDPFSDAGFEAFLKLWNEPVQDEDGARSGITRLAYRIYRNRTDLQSAMPDIFGGDYRRFLEWMVIDGREEYGLDEAFLAPVSHAIRTCRDRRHGRAWPETAAPNEFSNEPIGNSPANGGPSLRLTRLAAAIYRSRAELQHCFPDPRGRDSNRFLLWLLTYGKKEHNLSAHHTAPMEEQWRSMVGSLPAAPRLRHELIRRGMAASVHVRGALARFPRLRARLWRAFGHPRPTPWSVVAKRAAGRSQPSGEFGVNLVGYFYSETGVGQSVRAARGALEAAAVSLSLRCAGDRGPSLKQDRSAGPMSTVFPYSTNLFYVNADETANVWGSLGEPFYRNHHNIGFWVWELEEFPGRWMDSFAPYHEIWTPSTFCRDAVGRRAPIPVFSIPYAVDPAAPPGMDRQYFGLAPDRFIFLAAFDALSVMERKNPLAVIQAFERAFGADSRCQLVVKVNNAQARPQCVEILRNACSSDSVRVFESTLAHDEMYALTQSVDCAVSLHRSEGFGLFIAEAMYFGKPVIVTNYSGNTDFTHADNALLVGYRMIPVGHNCDPYGPACLWADPDVEQAASFMASIAGDAGLRTRLANAGQAAVKASLSPAAVGQLMRQRLEALCEMNGQALATERAASLRRQAV